MNVMREFPDGATCLGSMSRSRYSTKRTHATYYFYFSSLLMTFVWIDEGSS